MEETATAARRNGSAGGVFEIANLVPQRRPVKIGDKELLGWVRGTGCKRSVDGEYRAALARYQRAAETFASQGVDPSTFGAVTQLIPDMARVARLALDDSETAYGQFLELVPRLEAAASAPRPEDPIAWEEFLSEALLLALPGLSAEQADLMDGDQAFAVLVHLGWFQSPAAAAPEDGDAADPPEKIPETSAT